jgi:hypothetical protein
MIFAWKTQTDNLASDTADLWLPHATTTQQLKFLNMPETVVTVHDDY